MILIGINYGYHESAVAIFIDDELVFAAEEERFTRIKQDSSFPVHAIKRGLRELDLKDEDVDLVALSWPLTFESFFHDVKLFVSGKFGRTPSRLKKLIAQFLKTLSARKKFRNQYASYFKPPKKGFVFTNHHAAHAMSAFFLTGENDPVCVVFDGRGTTEATTFWKFTDNKLTKLFERSFPDSLGVMYANVTQLLGFQPLSDEWKVMGLAAYGEPKVDISSFVKAEDWELIFQGEHFLSANDYDLSQFEQTFQLYRRKEEDPIEQKHKDIAASAQLSCEKAILAYVDQATKAGKSNHVCLAGGVALNCKANGEVLRHPSVESLRVQPAAGDDGTAIGAALKALLDHGGRMKKVGHMTPYLGTAYTDDQIETILRRAKIQFERPRSLVKVVAGCLAQDQLVGWFQGRMEFGPRALGSRSILSSAATVENRDRVNEAVKFREIWRPFAPAVMHEHGNKYFSDYRFSPYMILSFWANDHAKQTIPAVVHTDGSCRVQSVTQESNALFHELLSEFAKITTIHALMNTSFNLKGEPIVESPLDALRTFYSSGLDMLAIGSFIIRKKYEGNLPD